MDVNKLIADSFAREKIEYYTVLSYSDCREINPSLRERSGFSPRSVILYLLPYYLGECENMSRYAASLDYHLAFREISERLIEKLSDSFPAATFKSYGDHSPIDECHAALIGGLGIRGDNGLLINERYGSYVFVGDILTDIDPETLGAVKPSPALECMHCGACKRACPTGILSGSGTDCLSAITQRKGELTEDEISLMRKVNTVWGCDLCQSSCPYNREPVLSPIEFFGRERIDRLTTELLDGMDKDSFSRRAFAWRGRRTVQRNLKHLGY